MRTETHLASLLVGAAISFAVSCGPAPPDAAIGSAVSDNDSGLSGEVASAISSALSEWLPEPLKVRDVPGAAAAVVDREAVIWEQVYGVTDRPGSSPITVDTIFCIRSISKSVTALGVLMAVQEGLVDLDTPISRYLPEFTVQSRFDSHPENLITLRQMLAHWAGFTHDPPAGLDMTDPDYFERYVASTSDTWLRFPVGYRHQYANRGYDLAASIIQVRSGISFEAYLSDRVLTRLGMENSSFDLAKVEQIENRAIGHDTKGRPVPVHFPEIPSAGLYSTIRDMSKYLQFHLKDGVVNGERILGQDLMKQFHSIQFSHRGQRTGYTMGLWREPVGNTFCLYHEGGGRGFGAHMIVYPELGVGAVILTNREYHGISSWEGRRIASGPVLNRYGPTPVADPKLGAMRRMDLGDPRLQHLAGRYGDSPGYVVGVENGVFGIRSSEDTFGFSPMTLFDEGEEVVGMYNSTMEAHFLPPLGPRPGSLMTVSRASSNSNTHYLDFNDSPLDPPGPNKPEWQTYLGEYDVIWEDEPNSAVTITVKNGYLYFRDGKCEEHEPGLFFVYDGEALDFRSSPYTYATQEIRKRSE